MKKEITIGEKKVEVSASALTPFSYKRLFGRDIVKDIQTLQKDSKNGELDPEMVSMMTYVMVREANKEVEPFEEWLSQFGIFDLYGSFGEIIKLWGLNEQTNSKPRKK